MENNQEQQANEQAESQQAEAQDQQAEGQSGDGQERIQELTNELKAEKESKALLEQNIELLKANAPPPKEVEQFDIFKHVGLNPDDPEDMANQGQLKAIINHSTGALREQLNQMRFMIEHPDYADLVGTTEQIRAGQFGEALSAALKANPALLATIQTSNQPQVAAYSIAKLYKQNKGQQTTEDDAKQAIDQAVQNANRIKSSSNTKGGAALTGENRYVAMPDAEFVELAIQNGANF
ncbi:MAG: hypothetical protein HWN69_07030 [Desulfobacterales bacterium]|nr:hypothetical protein [Desulfobacterales bacterium]